MYFILCFQKSTVRKKSSRRVILKVHHWITAVALLWNVLEMQILRPQSRPTKIRHSGIEVQQSVF